MGLSVGRTLRFWLFLAPLLGVMLATPALGSGLVSEDVWHGASARSLPWTTPLFGAPAARSRVVAANYAAKDAGRLPWIAVDDLRFAFLRPLSAALVHLDWALWPGSAVLMHAHSLLWYAMMLAFATASYRRLIDSMPAAVMAALFFALDPGHVVAATWLASRSVVVGVGFGLAALWAHDKARRERWWPGAVLTVLFLGAGLLAGEIALGVVGYLAAHFVLFERAPWRERCLGALAWLLPLTIWAGAYELLGYGTYGSGLYIDPVSEPGVFVRELPLRWSAQAFAALTRYPSDFFEWTIASGARALIVGAVALLVTASVAELVSRSREACFWALGAALSALAVCTTEPSGRVGLYPLFGGVALIAMLVTDAVRAPRAFRTRASRWLARALAAPLVLVHGVLAAVHKPVAAASLAPMGAHLSELASSVYEGTRPGQQVVVLDVPSYYTGTVIASLGALGPNRHRVPTRVLYAGHHPVTVVRKDARTLEVRAPHGFLEGPMSAVYRGRTHRMRVGQGLQLTGAQIVVTAVDTEGMPTVIEFRGAWPLDEPRYRFLAWNGRRYAPLPLPAPGASWVSGPW